MEIKVTGGSVRSNTGVGVATPGLSGEGGGFGLGSEHFTAAVSQQAALACIIAVCIWSLCMQSHIVRDSG
ncbi:MAG: hypothetical protein ACYDDO_03760 [Acidiferrobacterales bacterium]